MGDKKEGKPMKKHADEIELVFFNEETCFFYDNREEQEGTIRKACIGGEYNSTWTFCP